MIKAVKLFQIKIGMLVSLLGAVCFQTNLAKANVHIVTNTYTISTLPADKPVPAPDLTPQEVVAIQLRAFQENDERDAGIETAFNFAAPENRKYTGPIDFFKALVKNPTYEPLLNFKKVDAQKMHIEANEAQQIVVVTDKNGKKAAYLFSLSKQREGAYKGCWMTDSVIRLAYQDKTVSA